MSNDTSWHPLFWQLRLFSNCFPYLQHSSSSLCKAKVGMLPLLIATANAARVPIRLFLCPSLTVLLPNLGQAMVFHTHLQNHVSWGGTWSFSGLSDAQQNSRPHCPSLSWLPPLDTVGLGWGLPFMVKYNEPQLSWKVSLLSFIKENRTCGNPPLPGRLHSLLQFTCLSASFLVLRGNCSSALLCQG